MQYEILYQSAIEHQKVHDCSAVPYAHGELLGTLVRAISARAILEVGTGIGYSTVCLANGNPDATIHTIEKNTEHVQLARSYFTTYHVSDRIILHEGFAEDVLSDFSDTFDLIFYDGFIPQKKFVDTFYRLLRTGGLLVTTNLFLGDEKGGRYLMLLKESRWQTGIFDDSALSVKLPLHDR